MAEDNTSEEIDLGYLFRKISDFFKKVVRTMFLILAFYLKYWIVLLILTLLGVGYGIYQDSFVDKMYLNEGIVIPNFESVDYLYGKVDHFNDRLNQRDTVFIKQVFGRNYKGIKKIEIEPISDIYNMMTRSREQIDVFRILYQNQELAKFVEDITTSKYFKYHKITFKTKGENDSKEAISTVLNYWNSNEHYKEYDSVYKNNAVFQVNEYKRMIVQVDSLLAAVSREARNEGAGVIISENSNPHLLFDRKREMLNELLEAEKRVADYTNPIKLVYMDYDLEIGSFPNKIKNPVLLIMGFSLIFFFIHLYKWMREIAESE